MAEAMPLWVTDQFAKLGRMRPDLVQPAIQRALQADESLRWAIVVGAYLDGEVNLGKAAELLGLHRLELQSRFREQGIPIRVGPDTKDEAKAEVEAWAVWMAKLGT